MSAAGELRALPGVDRVMAALDSDMPHALVAEAARAAVAEARAAVQRGRPVPSFGDIVEAARRNLGATRRSRLQRVINATGVLVHTNLGRSPLGPRQLQAVVDIASGYSNLELDLSSGARGDRHAPVAVLLSALTGAEAALVANNNAAAVLVTLAAICAGRDVVISRGELIEIGGGFRIPEVMAASGARLVEVGTTNRTSIRDYAAALGPDTAAILKVHPSNYRISGFTAEVPAPELARLAHEHGLPLLYDLGSGVLDHDRAPAFAAPEPAAAQALAAGCDVVLFSGDKLLGGPQAGVVAGRADLVRAVGRHPLMRAVRPDKMTLAALQETLLAYLEGDPGSLPLWKLAQTPEDALRKRAERLAAQLKDRGRGAQAVPCRAVAGGGSLPERTLPSWGVAATEPEPDAMVLQQRLRQGDPPVIARIVDDRVVIDLRTVDPEDDPTVAAALASALSAAP